MPPEEITGIAKQVSEIAREYYLLPMVFSCREIIKDEFNQHIKNETTRLKEELQALAESVRASGKKREITEERIKRNAERVKQLRRPFAIRIVYFKDAYMKEKYLSRVFYDKDHNEFLIYMSRHMVDATRNGDGSVNLQGVKKLQWEMAYRVGCISLFFKELMEIVGHQGEKNALNNQQEEDAKVFASELIRLHEKRNSRNGLSDN